MTSASAPTAAGLWVSWRISQPPATTCSQDPALEARLASQTLRNSGTRRTCGTGAIVLRRSDCGVRDGGAGWGDRRPTAAGLAAPPVDPTVALADGAAVVGSRPHSLTRGARAGKLAHLPQQPTQPAPPRAGSISRPALHRLAAFAAALAALLGAAPRGSGATVGGALPGTVTRDVV